MNRNYPKDICNSYKSNILIMSQILIDYSQIQLQENIPLNEDEINNITTIQKRDFFKHVQASILMVVIIMVIIACYFLQNDFKNFKYYHYLLFVSIVLALYTFYIF